MNKQIIGYQTPERYFEMDHVTRFRWRWSDQEHDVWGDGLYVHKIGSQTFFVDPECRLHETMEDLLFDYRLAMCECVTKVEMLTLMRAYMASISSGLMDTNRPLVIEHLFSGNDLYCKIFTDMMEEKGMVTHVQEQDQFVAVQHRRRGLFLTGEGAAVLAMIRQGDAIVPSMLEVGQPLLSAPEELVALPVDDERRRDDQKHSVV